MEQVKASRRTGSLTAESSTCNLVHYSRRTDGGIACTWVWQHPDFPISGRSSVRELPGQMVLFYLGQVFHPISIISTTIIIIISSDWIPQIETSIEYTIQCMNKIQAEGIKSMVVRQDVLDELYLHLDTFHKSTVFHEPCRSWYVKYSINLTMI